MKNFNLEYQEIKTLFETELYKKIDGLVGVESTLHDAMKYSVKAGGKRFRPVLLLMTAKVLKVNFDAVMPYAIALEFLHTYSLIHDDLPAMDNDDYRRGKLTNHKVYGEAMAILAGDALLNLAYETLFRANKSIYDVNASRILSMYAGAHGMISGQALDILNENNDTATEDVLKKIHELKTGRLITASTIIPSCFIGDEYFNELKKYGENLGLLFQITDDLLDVLSNFEDLGKTLNKDENSKKLTFVTLYGIEGAKQRAKTAYENAVTNAKLVPNSELLIEMANLVYNRKN